MANQRFRHQPPGLHIPESGGAIIAGGQNGFAIGSKSRAVDVARVPAGQLSHGLAGLGIPDLGRVIPTGRDDEPSVGRKFSPGDGPVRAETH